MKIVILDTKCSNTFSLICSIKRLGFFSTVSSNKNTIKNADKLFIPGVGTALTAMESIYNNDLYNVLREYKKPVLGICLGMQLLCKISDENNGTNMLNVLDMHVQKLLSNNTLPIPHIGWNNVYYNSDENIFQGIKNGSHFYFIHTYQVPICSYTTSKAYYGNLFSASIQKKNFYGVQFHPEKSGKYGQQLIKNFLEI
ncbi:imidazole glycerol phosphate synthase subunit HisH [Buchnera aphidicola]|uniref:Imidazole glycerol phosphate synthase subunit HisH n=1 Tax=Buchnera aphidicola (Anoecia oenotherae) TaxID=1241833 RepID=A0A4D6Y031_9GAMM|nr:imidazole glycerol phosphate synthase subunit HisH [Buchnera aphidicola]QCI19221.1 imidazole glycerol phosphate synthase subunit HisH [Buchnera aphidicola (Anoecia oenotherae)]